MPELSQEREQQAINLGWSDKANWKGDPEAWVDAEAFLKRGEEIMPILKANNQELHRTVDGLKGQLQKAQETAQAAQEAIAELKKHHTEDTKRQVKEARAALYAELKLAKKAGDSDLEVDIMEKIQEFDEDAREAAKETPPPKSATKSAPTTPETDPIFLEWKRDNPWVDSDEVRSAAAVAIANRIRRDPATAGLVGRPFFDKITEEVEKIFSPPKARQTSKVEGSSGGKGGSPHAEGKRTFSDLPQAAREVCERQAEKLVGPGRAFKTKDEWKSYYVDEYFAGEEA